MGGEKSYCFLKAPLGFMKQVNDVCDIFMHRAHEKLMKKVKTENGTFEQFFSQVNVDRLKTEIEERLKENEKIRK